MDHKARNSNSELLTEPQNTERLKLSDDQLSHEFRRAPFLLYRLWLIVNFLFVLIWEFFAIKTWLAYSLDGRLSRYGIFMIIGLAYFLYGCCQMLHSISHRKQRAAQESFVKLQYALISSVIGWTIEFDGQEEKGRVLLFTQIIHLIGGFAVLRIFKKNHQGQMLVNGSNSDKDVLEQNEDSKYDKQLNKWPYFVYECLLKFSFIFELIFVFRVALPGLIDTWKMSPKDKERYKVDFYMKLFFAEWAVSSFMNAYACFQMEIATRTRNLVKSKRAVFLFKVCIGLAIIKCFFVGKCIDIDSTLRGDGDFLWYLGYSIILPVVSFLGAMKVNKILEQRENSSIDL